MENTYTEARLNDFSGQLTGKRWSISFWVYDAQARKKIRKFDYEVDQIIGSDNAETIRKRRLFAKKRILEINGLLGEGYHIDKTKAVIPEINIIPTAYEAVGMALDLARISRNSFLSYSSEVNIFRKWLKESGLSLTMVNLFSRKMAIEYIDFRGKSSPTGKTLNNIISYEKALFSLLKEREIIRDNPWVGIKKFKEVLSVKNLAYQYHEATILIEEIRENDYELFCFVQIIYNTFMRPNEIRHLKVGDIDLARHKIFLSATNSKNKKAEYISYPLRLSEILVYLVKNKSGNQYLFQNVKLNGPVSKNRMNNRHSKFLKAVNLDDQNHTLYSWKHTGVVSAYEAGIDLKRIQLQCRHSTVAQTDQYLKSLGLYHNDEFTIKMPPIG